MAGVNIKNKYKLYKEESELPEDFTSWFNKNATLLFQEQASSSMKVVQEQANTSMKAVGNCTVTAKRYTVNKIGSLFKKTNI
jgi:hypothetical protein